MSKNNLVLSSNSNYLSFEHNNIFFNDKIFYESDEKLTKKIKYTIPKDTLNEREERIRSFQYCEEIYNSIIKDLTINLNQINKVEWGVQSWSIILGGWLRRFIYIIFYRYNTLKNILSKYEITNVYLANSETNHLTSHESVFIHDLSINDEWNSILFSKIFQYIQTDQKVEKKFIKIDKKDFYEKKTFYESVNENRSTLNRIIYKLFSILKIFSSKKDGLIISSYLPTVEEKKLELLFFQIPKFFELKKINYKKIDFSLRKNLNVSKNCEIIQKIVRDLIPTYLPTFVLENFAEVLTKSKQMGYPSNPKFIFTSNSFEHDELFKFYVADIKNKNKKVKYFIGQHGSSYITRIDNNYANEVLTCDYFLSWGQKKFNHVKTIPLFNFKLPKKIKKKKEQKYITLIFRSLGYQCNTYNRFGEGKKEFLLAKNFINKLPKNLKDLIYLRFHRTYYIDNLGHNQKHKNFLKKFVSDLNCSKNFKYENYKKVIEQSKIVCFCYDSSGFLENLTAQIPSICLYPNIFNHLNEDCKIYYQDLKNAKIIFDDEKELIAHLQNIWPDVDIWWKDNKVQNVIKKIITQFCDNPKENFLRDMKCKIIEKIN